VSRETGVRLGDVGFAGVDEDKATPEGTGAMLPLA
jgi:hypothetical protein